MSWAFFYPTHSYAFPFDFYFNEQLPNNTSCKIHTLKGIMVASEYDYIIKGLKGEFYPCKPDVFEKKYELSEQTDDDKQKGMTEEEKNILSDSLAKLSSEKCEIEIGISSTCSSDCPFFINGAYGGECAIGIVSDNLN